ncbi:hypothetical protein DPX16_19182 [Anabarilius grahami]|uniref:Uncharacterized protein n=1 Tax=Anabarilius grahami TaxID=495550 RepID=A0A3N0Z0C5_ANAGA|nr:hypothetical protein DPX16_19182 [Anabarilius grahami]
MGIQDFSIHDGNKGPNRLKRCSVEIALKELLAPAAVISPVCFSTAERAFSLLKEQTQQVKAHSIRSVASFWALAHGASLTDRCHPARSFTNNTFARFYNLRVEPVSSHILAPSGQ